MMAKKARLLQEPGAAERIVSSPGPREHERIGRGVHNFLCCSRVGWNLVRSGRVRSGKGSCKRRALCRR